ncbi:MAG: hypothetical protein R3F62_10590 [Planctomycetota bacterium]
MLWQLRCHAACGGARTRSDGSVAVPRDQLSVARPTEFASRRRKDLVTICHSHRSSEGLITVWYGGRSSAAPPPGTRVRYELFRSSWESWDSLFGTAAAFARDLGTRLISISHSGESSEGIVAVWYWG